jgi:hypothetical protein
VQSIFCLFYFPNPIAHKTGKKKPCTFPKLEKQELPNAKNHSQAILHNEGNIIVQKKALIFLMVFF